MQTGYLWSQPSESLQHAVTLMHLNILSNIAIKCYLSAPGYFHFIFVISI